MDTFAALRALFIDRCRGDLERLSDSSAGDEEVAHIVHRLAGSAGSFGFPAVSDVAGDLDERIRNGARASPQDIARLTAALAATIADNPRPA